jgi:hypothetical protein
VKSLFTLAIVVVALTGSAVAQNVPATPAWTLVARTSASVPLGTVDLAGLKDVPTVNGVSLAKRGYVEEEYFISDAANVYALEGETIDFLKAYGFGGGRTVAKADVPYKTRIVIRRPIDVGKFSGTVQIEPIRDVTEGVTTWQRTWPYLVSHGDIWIGFTVSKANVQTMHKAFDRARYGSLDIPDEGLRWDIMAQVAGLARSPRGPLAMLGFLDIAAIKPGLLRVYSSGWSLTGCMQAEFISKHHGRWHRGDGKPIIDGYLAGICPFGGPMLVPKDAAVIQMMSESEYQGMPELVRGVAGARQADSNAVGEKRFRWYDIAGASHADYSDQLQFTLSLQQAGIKTATTCAAPISRLPGVSHFARAALRNLDDWVRVGRYPPPGKVFELNADSTIKRDAHGNAMGGVRPHWTAAPLTTFVPATPASADAKPDPITGTVDGFCALLGHEKPLPKDVVSKLYKDRADYIDKVTDTVVALVNEKYLLPADGDTELAKVRETNLP